MKMLVLKLLIVIFHPGGQAPQIVKVVRVSDHSTHIIGDSFEGVIFSKDYKPTVNLKKFTPDNNDIIVFETSLKTYLKQYNGKGGDEQYISKHLKSYKRQYSGYFNKKGEMVISVNCFCNDSIGIWQKEIVLVDDGGNCYWQIQLNLTTNQFSNFAVNGSA